MIIKECPRSSESNVLCLAEVRLVLPVAARCQSVLRATAPPYRRAPPLSLEWRVLSSITSSIQPLPFPIALFHWRRPPLFIDSSFFRPTRSTGGKLIVFQERVPFVLVLNISALVLVLDFGIEYGLTDF